MRLAGGKGAGIDNVGGVLLDLLSLLRQRGTRQSHETGTGRLEDTEGTDQLEEGVDTAGLGGAVERLSQYDTSEADKRLTPQQCNCCC
jgi:hypothetical protein